VAVKGGQPDLWRVSLTAILLNRARRIVFLVTGADKAAIVQRVLVGPSSPGLPVQAVKPGTGRTLWLLDRASAANLPPNPPAADSGKSGLRGAARLGSPVLARK
jgi:6-phosphogluconolactonase